MLSPSANAAANSQNSRVAWLTLLTFTLPGLEPLRVVNNNEDIISRGNKFVACGFDIILPSDDGEQLPTVKLRIDNADGMIIDWIRGFTTAPILMLEIVLSDRLDVVERSIDFLRLSSVGYDCLEVNGTLSVENVLSSKFPAESYSPVFFPAILT